MANNLSDLNDHLFAQIKRLGKEGLTPEQLQSEVTRTKAMSTIASDIVETAKLSLDALKTKLDYETSVKELPPMLRNNVDNEESGD